MSYPHTIQSNSLRLFLGFGKNCQQEIKTLLFELKITFSENPDELGGRK